MIQLFRSSIADTGALVVLYSHCVDGLRLPGDYGDLLRMCVVNSISALDRLVHDIVTHEMVEIFAGRKTPTPSFDTEGISLSNYRALTQATIPPAEVVFEGMVRNKLSHLSFIDPEKMANALSLVWGENHKWQRIASHLGRDQNDVKTELRTLYTRRNAIVHEADRDFATKQKLQITLPDAQRAATFVGELGEAIFTLVV